LLSSSSKNIRAKLVRLHAEHPASFLPEKGAPLDLGMVAQALVIQEQKHYESLEQAVEAVIDTLAQTGFTLGEAITHVRKGFQGASAREVYVLLVQRCANHVRSVFGTNTQNRLILTQGRFVQSSRELIPDALAPFDGFLVCLIRHLEFDHARCLPQEDDLEDEAGFVGRDQVILVAELVDCGLLEIEDLAGELPQYRLAADFEWEGRYRLYTRAMSSWLALRDRPKKREGLPKAVSFVDDADIPGAVPVPFGRDQIPEGENDDPADPSHGEMP
jgi:hypothetical protein